MNYIAHYARLVARARNRILAGYRERHHVFPRCLGGDDAPDNVVELTPEEHYVAHQLLVKIYPDNHSLLWALSAMTNSPKRQPRQNKLYGWCRRKFAATIGDRNRGQVRTPEQRARMSAARLGKTYAPHSFETKAKMSAASKGKPKSEAHRAALSKAAKARKRNT